MLEIKKAEKSIGWLTPSFISEGFAEFFANLHRILLFTLLTLVLSVPLITFGGAHLALFAVLRRIADGEKVTVKQYFAAFKRSFTGGIAYGLLTLALIVGMSLRPSGSLLSLCLVLGSFLLFTLLLFYPAVFNAGYRGVNAFARAAVYAVKQMGAAMFLLGLAVIFLFAAYYLSEILLVLFFTVLYYISARIVIANNGDRHSGAEAVKK